MAVVAALALLTLYPLGQHTTSLGNDITTVLAFFRNTGVNWALVLLGMLFLLHRLGLWEPWQNLVSRLWHRALQNPKRTVLCAAACAIGLAVLIGYLLYGLLPRLPDSVAMYVHAKIFAQGKLVGDSIKLHDFFDMTCATAYPRFMSNYLPGHIGMLAIGHLLHAPWLVNPVLGALSILVTYRIALETHGVRIALTAALLMLISPFFLFMSAEFMHHASSMFFAACFYWFFVRASKYHRPGDGLLAGLSLGMVLFIRPFNAILLGYPMAIYVVAWLIAQPHNRRQLLKTFLPCVFGLLFFIPLILKYNVITTGDPFTFSYDLTWMGKRSNIGFGSIPDAIRPWVMADTHSFWRGILYSSNNLIGLNYFMFRWPLPALFLVALAFALRGRNQWNIMFLTTACSLLLGYILYYHQGWHFGPRNMYEALPLLLILSASGLHRLHSYLRFMFGDRVKRSSYRAFVVLAALSASAAGFKTMLPGNNIDGATVPYDSLYRVALGHKLHHALVFVNDIEYIVSAVTNPPDDKTDIIMARDISEPRNSVLVEQYPDRNIYRITIDRARGKPPVVTLLRPAPFEIDDLLDEYFATP